MWKGVIGVEVGVDTGLVFPLVRVVEVLVDIVALLCFAEEERRVEAVAGTAGEEDGGRPLLCVVGDVLQTPVVEGRIGRE